jgi:hypothetical protein
MPLQSEFFAGDIKLEAAAVSDPAHVLQGAIGEHVAKIQRALIELDGATIDAGELQSSQYGPSTARAVLDYKRKRNIVNRWYQTTADDIVGRMTMAALDQDMLNHERHLELEIEGPFVPFQHKVAPHLLAALAFASFGPVAQVRPRPRPRPAPAPVVGIAMTDVPGMPMMSFRVVVPGADPAVIAQTTFHWALTITFDARHCRNGPNRQINETIRQTVTGEFFTAIFPHIRGGELTTTVSATIGKRHRQSRSHTRILGTNPSKELLFAALPHDTLRRISLQESGGRQFDAPVGSVGPCPLWSGDRLGGVGIFQITLPKPTADEVWNWRSNVGAGIRIFGQKLGAARGYPERVRHSARFRQLVNQFNADRRAHRIGGPLGIHLPDFTTGDFDHNLQQLELDAIRGFNGFAGSDGFGHELHEFRVALDRHGRLRVQSINEESMTGEAIWERVPAHERPQTSGDPNYVANVLAQQIVSP